jgi:hypothetical protein
MVVHLPPGAGRPKRDAVDVVRTRIWFQAVKVRSGLRSAHAIEAFINDRLSGEDVDTSHRPRKWYSYRNGSRSPSAIAGKRDTVADVEALFPGTARWYHHPFWKVLKREGTDPHVLRVFMLDLDPEVVEILYTTDEHGALDPLRLKAFRISDVQSLIDLGSFDALAAVVLLAMKEDANVGFGWRDFYLDAYQALQPVVAELPELVNDFPELFDLTDKVCQRMRTTSQYDDSPACKPWRELPWVKARQNPLGVGRVPVAHSIKGWPWFDEDPYDRTPYREPPDL